MNRASVRKKRKKERAFPVSAAVLLAAAAVLVCAFLAVRVYRQGGFAFLNGTEGDGAFFSGKKTVRLWYTDSALDDYLNEAALSLNEMNSGIRLDVTYKDEVEFLEQINRASIQGEDFPDLYITGNDMLEMAYLSGLAMPVENDLRFEGDAYYTRTALNAVTVSGVIAAYPMYFETAAFVYVPSLTEGYEIPQSIVDLIKLSNSYNAPANVRDVFKWDVNDIFYNYGFIGDAMDIGGEDGDDPEVLKIYDEDVLRCLLTYQQLSSYFSIDAAEVDYESVIDDFLHGRCVFTLATSDIIRRFDSAQLLEEEGLISSFGSGSLPDITPSIPARGMSVTYCLVTNGYSNHVNEAREAAKYLLYDHREHFYEYTGKLPVDRPLSLTDPRMDGFYAAYSESAPIPKMREMGNFWMLTETMLEKVWSGEEAEPALYDLYVQCLLQLGKDASEISRITDIVPVDIRAELTGGD